MMTAIMVIFVLALAVLLIGGAVKAQRMQRSAANGPQVTDYRQRLTSDDRRYIEESWKHAAGMFPQNPKVALDVAHNAVASVLNSRGIDSVRVPAMPDNVDSASPEELRQELLRYEAIVNDLTGAGALSGARDSREAV
ncbi:hypothetical protein GCM10009839_08690 [Catenulispora yoronensis]|uniref:Secreted protein n=1 Tax=Catenulispora yoronensis TaxID=450799 RepID=A0ABP5F348_9ACTN